MSSYEEVIQKVISLREDLGGDLDVEPISISISREYSIPLEQVKSRICVEEFDLKKALDGWEVSTRDGRVVSNIKVKDPKGAKCMEDSPMEDGDHTYKQGLVATVHNLKGPSEYRFYLGGGSYKYGGIHGCDLVMTGRAVSIRLGDMRYLRGTERLMKIIGINHDDYEDLVVLAACEEDGSLHCPGAMGTQISKSSYLANFGGAAVCPKPVEKYVEPVLLGDVRSSEDGSKL